VLNDGRAYQEVDDQIHQSMFLKVKFANTLQVKQINMWDAKKNLIINTVCSSGIFIHGIAEGRTRHQLPE
jgi:hypothetical protein